jgi:hypothetical protein
MKYLQSSAVSVEKAEQCAEERQEEERRGEENRKAAA